LRLDCLIGGLHLETDSYPMLPQQVDGLRNIVCSVCEGAYDKLTEATLFWKSSGQSENGIH
jgi:hypothetical protein